MAGAPSRDPVVLRRLGIVKDPNDPFLQESRTPRETSRDALELFAKEAESSARLEQRPNAIRPQASSSMNVIRRNPLIGVIAVSAVLVVVAFWAIDRFFGSDVSSVQTQASVAGAAEASGAASSEVPESTNTSQRPSATNANTVGSESSTIARGQQVVGNHREDVDAVTIGPATTASQPDIVDGPASAETPDAPAAVPPAAEPTAAVDDTIYSAQDRDVVPPQTSEALPGPTISSWTTRTNAMEVIVSVTGTVERVRLVSPPARMPDTFVLSRAKVWKFTPAMKDGRPVRYRLLLTWEVNP